MKKKKTARRNRKLNYEYQVLEPKNLLATFSPEVAAPASDSPFHGVQPGHISIETQNELMQSYLNSFQETQYLQQGRSSIELIDVKHGLASTTTHYQQHFNGLPIYNATVTISQNADGAVQRIHDSGVEKLELSPAKATVLSIEVAEAAAMRNAGVTDLRDDTTGELMWYVGKDGAASLSWVVMVAGNNPVGDFHTVVDADTNEVQLQENRIANFVSGTGDVFDPNPYQTQGSGFGLDDANDGDSPALDAQMISVTLQGLDEGTGLIKGEFVNLSDLNSDSLPDVDANEPSRIYEYTRSDPRFEQVVIYHSVDQIARYFHDLGFDDDAGVPNGIRDFPTLANAHWFTADNSFYSTVNDAIHFGDGGVDDGEDADIIAHEYGHAVQFNQNPLWGGGEMGAMGEGFGDYLAASFYVDFGDATFQSSHAAAVGEWDATSYSGDNPPNLRRVDGNKMYPDDTGGGVHADGEIWSRALWDIHNTLGRDVANQIILEAHFLLAAGADMPDGANAVLLADQNINGGANEGAIRASFEDRGILEAPPTQGSVSLDKVSYNPNDTVVVNVLDANASAPFTVSITTTGGDSETVTMSSIGLNSFTGMINTVEGTASVGDGTVQVMLGETLTVTYLDSDIGNGSSNMVSDSAAIANEFTSSDTPIDINDNTTFNSVVNVGLAGVITDINVRLDITHTYDGDLDIFLVSPGGDRVELVTDVGGTGEDFDNTIFDQESANPITSGSAPFIGDYRPEGDLSALYGTFSSGDWILEVTDDAGGDTGTLNSWGMIITTSDAAAGSVSLGADGHSYGDTVEIQVTDTNAGANVDVEVTTTSGDSETVTLTGNGNGVYTGSIVLVEGGVTSGDGQLQGEPSDTITVTYDDADDGSGNSAQVTTTGFISNVTVFASADTPIAIEDNTTITSVIDVPLTGVLNDIDVILDISHTFDGDLDVFLIGPDGTRVELFQDVGGTGENFTGTILDDEADQDIASGSAPFTGRYRPVGSLSDYDAMDPIGDWTLEITDDAGADQGTLNSWSVAIDVTETTTGPVTVTPDSVTPTRGQYFSGDIVDLSTLDSEDYRMRRSSTDVISRTQFEVTGMSPVVNPTSIELTLVGSVFARTEVNQTIEMFNYDTNSWEQVDVSSASRFFDVTTSVELTGDLSRFVDDSTNEIQSRITFQSTNPRQQFSSNTDMFTWTIE